MIPKKIHYCWFGNNKIPKKDLQCINSWNKHCPDYEIKKWDETNFDIKSNRFVMDAYKRKKWAFISDYVRLYALVNEGGIYMDTDVELINSLEEFLKYKAFAGFESKNYLSTGILASEEGFEIFKSFLLDYDNNKYKDFIIPNSKLFTKKMLKRGLILNNKRQNIEGLEIFPSDVFSPKSPETLKLKKSKNTIAIHHFHGSWFSPSENKIRKIRIKYSKSGKPYKIWADINIKLIHVKTRIEDTNLKNALIYYFKKLMKSH